MREAKNEGETADNAVARTAQRSKREAPKGGGASPVEAWVERTLRKGVKGLCEEFMGLKRWYPEDMTTNAFKVSWVFKKRPTREQTKLRL